MRKTKWYQEATYLLIALALALFVGVPFVPRAAASPDQATFYSRDSDGHLWQSCSPWFDCDYYTDLYGASTGSINSTRLDVGQCLFDAEYSLYRAALFFDTRALPDDACITSATLSLYGRSSNAGTDFFITVVDGSVLNEPLVDTDYGALRSQNVSGGTLSTSGLSIPGYNDIPLNGTGMGWISKTGITRFGLRGSREIDAIAPSTAELVHFYASEQGAGYQPRLVVNYTTPVPVGGEAYPVNKISILALWVAAGIVLAGGLIWYALRRRRAQS